MKLPAGYRVGAATHTGRVRGNNEDDYLLLDLAATGSRAGALLLAVADGMGGVAGGGEASRAALRAFADHLAVTQQAAPEALEAALQAAVQRVLEVGSAAGLQEMGTTLTAAVVDGPMLQILHIGDCRALLLRRGQLAQLTTDHSVPDQKHVLLRCIGAGQQDAVGDLRTDTLARGDRLLLCSDGVWGVLAPERIAALLGAGSAQDASELLVEASKAAGGPDNATAVVLEYTAGQEAVEATLPREELPGLRGLRPAPSLVPPRWPWLLLVLALVAIVFAVLRWLDRFDVLAWLQTFAN